jgi:hypothetical protein
MVKLNLPLADGVEPASPLTLAARRIDRVTVDLQIRNHAQITKS